MTIRSALAVLLVSLAAIPTVIGQEDPEAPLDIGKE